ncbi:hypothetical protein CMI38_03015, partial [Candidatus Pacearchaeota archaeon]|nr:hypothetical protein [Candidatus Pacearchaeota archaeon]
MTQTLNSISERLGSYAELGIKTLAELIEEDILIDGSSTPGDFCEGYFDPEFDDIEELRNIRGYLISKDNINETLYGRNGFFSVALEKQGEAINRADNLPIPELEKRLKNSALLLVRPDKLNINQRSDNGYDEDLALHSIAPEDI